MCCDLKHLDKLEKKYLLALKRFGMSKYKCKCLNITIHVKEKATRETDGKAFVSSPEKTAFFLLDLSEVELAVGGITKVTFNSSVFAL